MYHRNPASEIDREIATEVAAGVGGIDARAGDAESLFVEQVDDLYPEQRVLAIELEQIARAEVHRHARRHVERVVGGRRSGERRVGKECVSTFRSRWSPSHYNNK